MSVKNESRSGNKSSVSPKNIPSRSEAQSVPYNELVRKQILDDPSDESVLPMEPRCKKCGATYTTQDELLEHSKTCKGGHDISQRPHRS
jgi:hypothetical protein